MQDPIKSIHFSNSNPVCHAFDQDAKDGHDLIIGLNSGDGIYLLEYDFKICLWDFKISKSSIKISCSLLSVTEAAITGCWKEACWCSAL